MCQHRLAEIRAAGTRGAELRDDVRRTVGLSADLKAPNASAAGAAEVVLARVADAAKVAWVGN